MKILSYQNNFLFIENCELATLLSEVETPAYLYSENDIRNNCREIVEAAQGIDFMPCYALKANFNPAILKIIGEYGFGVDVVSGGEMEFALKAGIPAAKIVFAGVGKTEIEIRNAIKTGIHSLNVESAGELSLISRIAGELKRKTSVALRVNPDIDPQTHPYISTGLRMNKFGIPIEEALVLFQKYQNDPYLLLEGLHVHIGSQITDPKPYLETAQILKNLKMRLSEFGVEIKFLDLGGGIGINYQNQLDEPGNRRTYLSEILPHYLNAFSGLNIKLVGELGRSIVGSAGFLATRILYHKNNGEKDFLIVDAAMNNLIRPSLYQAFHQILPVVQQAGRSTEVYDIVGPVCESGDYLAKSREIQESLPGEYLLITGAGAYGQALASNYNLRPNIAEILINNKEYRTIFKRQDINDLAKNFDW